MKICKAELSWNFQNLVTTRCTLISSSDNVLMVLMASWSNQFHKTLVEVLSISHKSNAHIKHERLKKVAQQLWTYISSGVLIGSTSWRRYANIEFESIIGLISASYKTICMKRIPDSGLLSAHLDNSPLIPPKFRQRKETCASSNGGKNKSGYHVVP